jgi:soluble lytic murein transglycosylase
MSGREVCVSTFVVAVLLVAACGRSRVNPAQPPVAEASPAPSPSLAQPEPSASPPRDAPWPALVRDEQWDAAWRALEALGDAEKSGPEVRYVRARVAMARGDAPSAMPLFEGLESALPLLAADIEERRAEAALLAGPFAQAGEWFAARPAAASQLQAARAFEKAKDPRRALAAAEKVLASSARTRAEEGEARHIRIRVAGTPGDTERADARWLATQGADLPAASDALALVATLSPGQPLTAQELMVRGHVLADAGKTDDALRAIELAASAPGNTKLTDLDRTRARGMVLYRARGRWAEAAKTLTECAVVGGSHAGEDAFHAARALSRADRDDEAIRGYEDVERRFSTSTWGEQAAFFVPYLHMLHGEWHECAKGFDAYLRAHSSAADAPDARRDGALCKLLGGDTRPARLAFEHLVEDVSDATAGARMADLAALAALRDGDKTHAVARWTDVARTHPLSWPALVARARLREVGAEVPPNVDPQDPAAQPPAALAVRMPSPADILHRIGLDADAEIALRSRESSVTAEAGARGSEALCDAYGQLGRAKRRYQIAQSLPSAFFLSAPGTRTRWAWECAFPSPYEEDVHAAEEREKLPHGLLWAVMRQESAYDPDAVSPARAVGLMQLLPETARPVAEELGLAQDDARLTSPPYAIAVGARVLRRLLERFHGSVPLAVAAYNGGADSVERWLSRAPGMQIDAFVERIPFKETRDYVARVMGNLAHYGYLASGDAGVPDVQLELPARPTANR